MFFNSVVFLCSGARFPTSVPGARTFTFCATSFLAGATTTGGSMYPTPRIPPEYPGPDSTPAETTRGVRGGAAAVNHRVDEERRSEQPLRFLARRREHRGRRKIGRFGVSSRDGRGTHETGDVLAMRIGAVRRARGDNGGITAPARPGPPTISGPHPAPTSSWGLLDVLRVECAAADSSPGDACTRRTARASCPLTS